MITEDSILFAVITGMLLTFLTPKNTIDTASSGSLRETQWR